MTPLSGASPGSSPVRRGSFFKSLDGQLVLRVVARPRRDLGEAERLQLPSSTIENLRRAFPYQRRLLKIVIKLSDDLNRKIPRREKSEHLTAKPRDAATTYLVSKHSLTAARQAIEELGPNAPRHKLLSYAATILEKQ